MSEWIHIWPIEEKPDEEYLPEIEEWNDINRNANHTGKFRWSEYGNSKNMRPGDAGAFRRKRRPKNGPAEIGPEIWIANEPNSFTVANAGTDAFTGEARMIPGTEVRVPKTQPPTEIRRGGFIIGPQR